MAMLTVRNLPDDGGFRPPCIWARIRIGDGLAALGRMIWIDK